MLKTAFQIKLRHAGISVQYKEKSLTPTSQPVDKLAADSLPLMRRQYGDRADVSIGRSIRYCSCEPGKFVTVPGGYDEHCPDDLLSQSSTISRPSLPTNASKEDCKLLYVNIVRVSVAHRHLWILASLRRS